MALLRFHKCQNLLQTNVNTACNIMSQEKCDRTDVKNDQVSPQLDTDHSDKKSKDGLSQVNGQVPFKKLQLMEGSTDSGINEDKMSGSQLGLLLEENASLRKRLSQEMEMNKELCSYDEKRQDYIGKLQEKMVHLMTEISDLQKQVLNPQNDSSSDDNNTVTREEFLNLQRSYENSIKRNCMLEKDLKENKIKLFELRNQLTYINNEYKEHKKLIDLQLKAHKEDWEAESAEKSKAIWKCKQLSSFVEHLKSELQGCKENFEAEKAGKFKAEKSCQDLKHQLVALKSKVRSRTKNSQLSSKSQETQESTSLSSPEINEITPKQIRLKEGAIALNKVQEKSLSEPKEPQREKCESSSPKSSRITNKTSSDQLLDRGHRKTSIPASSSKSCGFSPEGAAQATIKLSDDLSEMKNVVEEHKEDGYLVCPSCYRVFDVWRRQELAGHYEDCRSRMVVDS